MRYCLPAIRVLRCRNVSEGFFNARIAAKKQKFYRYRIWERARFCLRSSIAVRGMCRATHSI